MLIPYCNLLILIPFFWKFNVCVAAGCEEDLRLIYETRKSDILQAKDDPIQTQIWRDSLNSNGNWSDVDYTSGCSARRANWPAQDHFQRIITLASHWVQNQEDSDLQQKISLALDFWFGNDFPSEDCINGGGVANLNCPCGTPGFWNTNWYCQMILMPTLVGQACLLLKDNLTGSQLNNCTNTLSRSYNRIDGDSNGQGGPMTGANMLDVASNAINLALISNNSSTLLINEALERYYNEAQITTGFEEGIKIDGAFWQHDRQIYNGNYGAVFMRALISIFIQTGNEECFNTPPSVQEAFLKLIEGNEWLIFQKTSDKLLMWQYSVIGRMVSHKFEDWNGIGLNLNQLLEATKGFDNSRAFEAIVNRLQSPVNSSNSGNLIGTKYFHTSDYLVNRGAGYILALKMYSNRSTNSECNNGQNPYGFHLSDGTLYTYLTGDEYVDVFGAWDWNLIPGTTTDYDATPLKCGSVQHRGKEGFVGAVVGNSNISNSNSGAVAVMNYTNPLTGFLNWKKTWFFVPGAYSVQFVGDIISFNKTAQVLTTLDQKQLNGPIFVNGIQLEEGNLNLTLFAAKSLWHDRVGYFFQNPVNLILNTIPRRSNWSEIGISNGFEEQRLFSAVIQHSEGGSVNADLVFYTAYLDLSQEEFENKSRSGLIQILQPLNNSNNAIVRGATYGSSDGGEQRIIGLAFWKEGYFLTGLEDIESVSVDKPVLILIQRGGINAERWSLSVADPNQSVDRVKVEIAFKGRDEKINLEFDLPQGPLAGSSIHKEIFV